MPTMPLGEVSEMTVQPSAPMPLPKNESDMKSSMTLCAVSIVAGDDGHGERHARHDGQLAREAERMAAVEELVADDAAQNAAEAAAEAGHRGGQPHLDHRHVARLGQIERKPGEKEPGEGGDAVLADVDAHQHAMAQAAS